MADHGFLALPPDGSGKKTPQTVTLEFDYDTGTTQIAVGDEVSFSTSTFTGVVILTDSLASGTLTIRIASPVPVAPSLTGSEDVLVDAVKVAQVASTPNMTTYYYQENIIVGGENSANHLEVNRRGAAHFTFSTGSPTFDSFGKQRVSQSHLLGEYIQAYDELPDKFTDATVGAGSLTYVNASRGVTLTNTTASGDSYQRTTNQYHLYQAGVSTLIEMTCNAGDTGKANVDREWGYYDDDNGVFFNLTGTTLGVTLRSKVTGSVVNEVVDQADWNVDRMDGTDGVFNPSGHTLDVSKANIYWIDYQWLGAGLVRMGVIIDGEVITCHQFENANKKTSTYMSTGSLPVRYEQTNTGTAGSTSEFFFYCAAVHFEGSFEPAKSEYTGDYNSSVTTTSDTLIASARPLQTYKTFDNRGELSIDDIIIHNAGTDTAIVRLYSGGTVTGGTWNGHHADSIAEINETATFSGGKAVKSFIVKGGDAITFNMSSEATLYRNADITTTSTLTITAALLSAGTGGTMTAVVNWEEVLK